MADRYDRGARNAQDNPMRYRDQEGRERQYDGGDWYERDRDFEREQESAPAGRWGQGRSQSRFGQQGWQREQEPGQRSRANDWSRGLDEGEWQRQQQWELQQSRQNVPYTERTGQEGGYWETGERGRQERGGAYGGEYPESSYRSPGGYGELYRGDTRQYSGQGQSAMYERERRAGYMAGPYAGRGPKGYQRSDDRIKEDVCERLTQHDEIDAEDIDVQVRNGEVILSGSVMDRYQKRMAEDAIEGVSGVRDINNQLRAGFGDERRGQAATAGAGYSGSAGTSRSVRTSASRSSGSRAATGASGKGRTAPSKGTGSPRGTGTSRSASATPANRPLAGSPPSTTNRVSTPGGQSPTADAPSVYNPARPES